MINKITVKNSKIGGKGTFAKRDIKKGEIVLDTKGKLVPDGNLNQPSYIKWSEICYQTKQGYHLCPNPLTRKAMNGLFFVNHSCDPNCGMSGETKLMAMRDIKKGEEVTFDYAMTDANYKSMKTKEIKCLCKKPNCRKLVTGEDWRDKKLQKKYKGFFSDYVQSRINKLDSQ